MSNPIKTNKRRIRKSASGWDAAIADAKKRIRNLQFSIEVFKKHKRTGESWPGSATHN